MLQPVLPRAVVVLTATLAGLLPLAGEGAQAAAVPPIGHVFVINLENKGYEPDVRPFVAPRRTSVKPCAPKASC
jgi:hypothetical protein